MNEADFATALKTIPCPHCSKVGYLRPEHLVIKSKYKGHSVEAEGEGSGCTACGAKFMSNEMTAHMSNQTTRIDQGSLTHYQAVNLQSGEVESHPLQ